MDKILLFVVITTVIGPNSAQTKYGKELGSFPNTSQHDVAGTIYVIDETTIWVRGFTYDGTAPDAFFYAGETNEPSGQGVIIPDEAGTTVKLGAYDNENLILSLPVGKTINSFRWISIWCRQVGANFGHVTVPSGFVSPDKLSIGELGFSPRVHNTYAEDVIILNSRQLQFVNLVYDGQGPAAYFWIDSGNTPTSGGKGVIYPSDAGRLRKLPKFSGETVVVTLPADRTVFDIGNIGLWCDAVNQDFGHVDIPNSPNVPPYLGDETPTALDNCVVLSDGQFHLSWTLYPNENKIMMQFIGIVEMSEYLAFGISGSDTSTSMIGSDVTVVYIDSNDNQPKAEDYYLNAYSQCTPNDGRGACPDELQGGVDDVTLQGGIIRDGITRITVERPLIYSDANTDKNITTDGSVFVSWGIGGINPTGHVAKHTIRADGNVAVNFGRDSSTCPQLDPPTKGGGTVKPWDIDPIRPKPDEVITARIGPSGDAKGYQGIAGQVGWGIAWYLNDLLIPEIYVQRNKTYRFEIYGGDDPDNTGVYHPFYITNDKNGGYRQKTTLEKQAETIYAGPAAGTLCEYKGDADPLEHESFEDYFKTLDRTSMCPNDATPEVLEWFVENDTPDLVYYQCYQHKFFGWKIHVSAASATAAKIHFLFLFACIAMFALD